MAGLETVQQGPGGIVFLGFGLLWRSNLGYGVGAAQPAL
jgi:hypothetical protein